MGDLYKSKMRALDDLDDKLAELDPEKVKAFQMGFGGQGASSPPPQSPPSDDEKKKQFYQSLKRNFTG